MIDPAFNDFIKEVMPTYPIGEILPKRDEIRRKAIGKLSENLVRYHIVIDDINIANISFSPQYTQAIRRQANGAAAGGNRTPDPCPKRD